MLLTVGPGSLPLNHLLLEIPATWEPNPSPAMETKPSSSSRSFHTLLLRFSRRSVTCKLFTLLLILITATIVIYSLKIHKANNTVYDIDIGTLGTPISKTSDVLITFDPFDKKLITPTYERHPYIVTDYDGVTNFTENQDSPGCSTINRRNVEYNMTKRFIKMEAGCAKGQEINPHYELCLAPKRTKRQELPCIRLSSFVKERGIKKVRMLKVDAQGTDFSIIKDLFENVPDIVVKNLMFECQFYDKGIPMFYVMNDCEDALTYLRQKRRVVSFREQMQGCQVEEYNLIVEFDTMGAL